MNLVIVESPSKCSKIQGFLGNGWKVLASMGHIRQLVEDLKGLHIEDGFNPDYEFMKDKFKTISQLKDAAKSATKIYLASDDDREGEAISYSVALALKLNVCTNPRIVFHEITKSAVLKAIENPRTINMNRVNSQQARAVLDLMVGFTISPLLWRFVGSALSAGRCQTPALRLIVEKENDIDNFKSSACYEVKGSWSSNSTSFSGKIIDTLESEEDANNYFENIHTLHEATITNVITRPTIHNPPQPLITSSLQQEASALYGSNPKTTMKVAQKLYEDGHITYMRTDCINMSEEAILEAKKQVQSVYGSDYVSNGILKKCKSDQKTQDMSQGAHEAIRPTHFDYSVLTGDYTNQERNIYTLIYKRALQSVMSAAKGEERKIQWMIDEDPSEFIWESTFKKTTFQGWKIVGQSETNLDEKEEEETQAWEVSQKLTNNLKIKWDSLQAEEKCMNPPSRYNEATLVRELEKKGIGRPSTFASLVSAIVDKNYVEIKVQESSEISLTRLNLKPDIWPPKRESFNKKVSAQKQKMFPTLLGKQVYEFCMKEFKELFDYGFTKQMEDRLDLIESGSDEWKKLCSDTYNSYKDKYETLKKVPAKEISNSKKIVLANGYEAVVGKFGPVLIKDKAFLGWPEGVSFKDITDALVEKFITDKEKPDIFGYHEGEMLVRKKGKFGEYIVYNGTNISLKPGDSVESIIERSKSKSETLHTLGEFVFKNGAYGPYMMKKVTAKGKKPIFVSLPSGLDVKSLTEEAAKKIYETNMNKPKRPFKKKE
uniref:DNA topoisomerase n=1 Tax=viral metagenome TaxID=1070528 RepID=A0A6C0D6T1_9ZZZZ